MSNISTKINVAVVSGGDSMEAQISHRSARQVISSLDDKKYNIFNVVLEHGKWSVDNKYDVDLNDFSFRDNAGNHIVFDYALIVIHGTPGEDGILQGYFQLKGIPFSGCDVRSSALTFDKVLCKSALRGVEGVNLAKERVFVRGQEVDYKAVVEDLGLPLFVKPAASGSSLGVTKVKSLDQMHDAVLLAMKESDIVLVEEYIEGVEVSQGIYCVDGHDCVLPITELSTTNEFFDFEAKYQPGITDEITPARISDVVKSKLNNSTLDIYKRLGLRGVVRIDYIIKGDVPYFIEVNTTPGMSEASIVPKQLEYIGSSIGQMYDMIMADDMTRLAKARS